MARAGRNDRLNNVDVRCLFTEYHIIVFQAYKTSLVGPCDTYGKHSSSKPCLIFRFFYGILEATWKSVDGMAARNGKNYSELIRGWGPKYPSTKRLETVKYDSEGWTLTIVLLLSVDLAWRKMRVCKVRPHSFVGYYDVLYFASPWDSVPYLVCIFILFIAASYSWRRKAFNVACSAF